MADFHSKSVKETFEILKTERNGLKTVDAEKRLRESGKNIISEEKPKSVLSRFFAQFADFSIIVLLVAAGISAVLSFIGGEKDFTDTAVILAIVVLNAIIGTLQERKAQKALDALKKMSSPEAYVKRDGVFKKIPAEKVVKGDIISLKNGDMICADGRIISDSGFSSDESALTGESLPAQKSASRLPPKNAPTAERSNCVFASTLAVSGHCEAVVTATGKDTEIGKIAGMLLTKDEDTPLQKRLSKLSKALGAGALLCCAVIFVLGIIRKNDILSSFMLAVSLAVAAIPEGLPAIVTIVLSRGVGKLASRGAIIRHLPSCETLGNATFICSDKTGTLTENRMTVTEIRLPRGGVFSPESFECKDILKYAALCTNCEVQKKRSKTAVTGEPTEKALFEAAIKNGFDISKEGVIFKRIKEIPFDSTRKMMSTVYRLNSSYVVITKGAPQYLLKLCTSGFSKNGKFALTKYDVRAIENANNDMAEGGLRVIGVAFKEISSLNEKVESDLSFMGLIGMEDPPRKEAENAVKKCKEAGITPVMITGDQLITAKVIAKRLGILEPGDLAKDGAELDAMSDEELKNVVKDIRVYARATPEHKMRIIRALKSCGETVAMTGDGINDAPAL